MPERRVARATPFFPRLVGLVPRGGRRRRAARLPPGRLPAQVGARGHLYRLRRRANRGFLTVEAKKKGFAELLSDIVPKDEDYNGRPRLEKGKVSAKQHVPNSIPKPPYADTGHLPPMNEDPQIHDAEGEEKMRAAGLLAAQVLDYAETIIKPGITADFVDQKVHKMTPTPALTLRR